MQATQAFIGVGANLGDRWGTIQNALGSLQQTAGIGVVERSSVYESDPVGLLEQPLFLNLVAGVETTLIPEELLRRLLEIEQQLGRQRTVRWGPRTIDLDLLLFGGAHRSGPELELPHPRIFERAFVVEPLRELVRLPRFQGPLWIGLREQLTRSPHGQGLRPWQPA